MIAWLDVVTIFDNHVLLLENQLLIIEKQFKLLENEFLILIIHFLILRNIVHRVGGNGPAGPAMAGPLFSQNTGQWL